MTDKVIRNGMVAILYSPSYGAGWSSWNTGDDYLYCPKIVEAIEVGKSKDEITKLAEEILGTDGYYGGARDLTIAWIKEGTLFRINEYDGSESIEVFDIDNYKIA